MTWWMQPLNTIIFTFGVPFAVMLAIHWTRILAQKLPEQQRLALEQFARLAVQQIEQESSILPGTAKKQLATASIIDLFNGFGLPVPHSNSLNIALEAAVLMLPSVEAPPK